MNSILHLAGEQPIPVYMGVMQYDCPNHVLAVTDRTRPIGEAVRAVCTDNGRNIELLEIDAYDMQAFVQKLSPLLDARRNESWAFNLTGGTKPMFAAAFRLAQSRGFPSFYIETTNRTVDWLDETGKREPLHATLDSIDTFITLAAYERMTMPERPSPLDSPEGRRLLETMWKQRQKLQGWHRIMARYAEYSGVPFLDGPRNLKGTRVAAELKGPEEGYRGRLRVNQDELTLTPWPDLARFACGAWLEDFLYGKARMLLSQGNAVDVCKNVFVSVADDDSDRPNPFQEFDLALSDGYFLTIAECKAGDIDQGHIQKLENLAQRFGGHFGRGVLIAGRPERLEGVRERIERSRSVCGLSADAVVRAPSQLLTCKPGTVVVALPRT